jgi:hypothetical protein
MTRREPDAIREAVGAAEDAWRHSPGGTGVPAAIVAFLRRLPKPGALIAMRDVVSLANEVERAAKEAGDA